MASFFKTKLGRNKKTSSQHSGESSGAQGASSDGPEKTGDISMAAVREEAVGPAQEMKPPQVTASEDQVAGAGGRDRMEHKSVFGPTVHSNSIFSGLQLSHHEVGHSEVGTSKENSSVGGNENEGAGSSFSFLHKSEDVKEDVSEDNVSMEDSCSTGGNSTGGFAFLQELPSSQAEDQKLHLEEGSPSQLGESFLAESRESLQSGVSHTSSTHSVPLSSTLSAPPPSTQPAPPPSTKPTLHSSPQMSSVQKSPLSTGNSKLSSNLLSPAKERPMQHSPNASGKKPVPSKGNKKIKRRAVRPGHNREGTDGSEAETRATEDSGQRSQERESITHHPSSSSLQGHSQENSRAVTSAQNMTENLVDTSVEKLVDTSVENLVGTSVENLVDTSVENLVDTSIENLVDTSLENLIDTSTDKVVENSIENLVDTGVGGLGDRDREKNVSESEKEGRCEGEDDNVGSMSDRKDSSLPPAVDTTSVAEDTGGPNTGKERDIEGPASSSQGGVALEKGVACSEGVSSEEQEEVGLDGSVRVSGVLDNYGEVMMEIRSKLLSSTESHRTNIQAKQLQLQQHAKMWSESAVIREKEARALAEEDYELVEQLRNQLEAAESRTERDLALSCMTEISEWVEKVEEGCKGQVTFQESMLSKLKTVKEEHHDNLEKLRRSQAAELAKEKMQLQALSNEVERKAGHIALDRSHWEKRKQLVEEEADRRAATFIAKKKLLTTQLDSVENEISELEEKLKSLCAERATIISAISAEEGQIQVVNEDFSEEKDQLHQEDLALLDKEQQLSQQQQSVQEQQSSMAAIEGRHYLEREKVESQMKQAVLVLNEVQSALTCQPSILAQIQQLQEMICSGRKHLVTSTDLSSCLEKEREKKEEVERQTQQVLEGQTSLGAKRKNLRDLQEKLGDLQESKKAAVTGRQFKEASRFANLIKSVSSEVSEEEDKLSEAEKAVKMASERLDTLGQELSALHEEVSQLERKEDEACIVLLLADVKTLQNKVGHSAQEGGASLSVAMEMWKKLYLSLAECLSSRHGLSLANMYSENESDGTVSSEVTHIKDHVSPDHTPSDPTSVSSLTSDGNKDMPPSSEEGSEVSEVLKKCQELEEAIQKACDEEDYDRAAELQEELVSLQENKVS